MRQIDYLIDQYGTIIDPGDDTFNIANQQNPPGNTKIILSFWTSYTRQGNIIIPQGNISSLDGLSGTVLIQYQSTLGEPALSDIPGGLIDISKNWTLKPVDIIAKIVATCTDIVGAPYIQIQSFGGM